MKLDRSVFACLLTFSALTHGFLPADAYAQIAAPVGSYGLLLHSSENDITPADNNGAAFVGAMNFDGSGNVTGTYTFQTGGTGGSASQTASGSLTGTYSGNPDGTGTLSLNFDFGAGLTFATVLSDAGQVLRMVSTAGSGDANNLGGGFVPLKGTPQSVTGVLPAGLFIYGASGNLNFTLPGFTTPGGALTVFSTSGTTASGPVTCDDGTTQVWNATLTTLMVAISPSAPGAYLGDYVFAVAYTECGNGNESQTFSGSVSGNVDASGNLGLVLHGSGLIVTGVARAGQTASLNGSYSFEINNSPTPASTIGVLKFDGAGNAVMSATLIGAPGTSLELPVSNATFAGTYSINPNGTGTINLTAASGTPSQAFSFVITDNGSEVLLLRTDGATGADVVLGTARKQ